MTSATRVRAATTAPLMPTGPRAVFMFDDPSARWPRKIRENRPNWDVNAARGFGMERSPRREVRMLAGFMFDDASARWPRKIHKNRPKCDANAVRGFVVGRRASRKGVPMLADRLIKVGAIGRIAGAAPICSA